MTAVRRVLPASSSPTALPRGPRRLSTQPENGTPKEEDLQRQILKLKDDCVAMRDNSTTRLAKLKKDVAEVSDKFGENTSGAKDEVRAAATNAAVVLGSFMVLGFGAVYLVICKVEKLKSSAAPAEKASEAAEKAEKAAVKAAAAAEKAAAAAEKAAAAAEKAAVAAEMATTAAAAKEDRDL